MSVVMRIRESRPNGEPLEFDVDVSKVLPLKTVNQLVSDVLSRIRLGGVARDVLHRRDMASSNMNASGPSRLCLCTTKARLL